MTTLTFAVENKVVTRTDENSVIGDNINEYNAVFTLDEEWTDTVTAIFSKGSVHKTQILTENSCVIPWEVLVGEGNVSVSVFSGELKTSVPAVFPVVKSGYQRSAITSAVPTPSEYAQIIEAYGTLLTKISEVNEIGKITEYQTPIYNLETGVYTVDEGGTLLLGDTGEELEYGIVFVSNEAASGNIDFLAIGRDNAWLSAIFQGKAVLTGGVWDTTYSILPQHVENADNRVTSVSDESTDEQYPSAKALYNFKLSDANFTENTINGAALRTHSVTGNKIMKNSLTSDRIYVDSLGKNISSASTDAQLATGKAVYTYAQPKSLYFSDVSASSWTSDTTYAGYGYKCEISLTGVTDAMVPYITLGHAEAVSGNYSPVALSGTGTITIYSKVNTSITIPLIKAEVV